MTDKAAIKARFDALYEEWKKVVASPAVQLSSRPQDYTNNEPYREIIGLGRDALPFILEKLREGEFFMNEAALAVSGLSVDGVVKAEMANAPGTRAAFLEPAPPQFLSEQQKAELILRNAR